MVFVNFIIFKNIIKNSIVRVNNITKIFTYMSYDYSWKGMNKLRSEKKSIKKFLALNLEKISFKLKL